jgi:hypothetical protein
MRTILLIVAIAAIVLILRHLYRKRRDTAPTDGEPSDTIRCVECGVYVPRRLAREESDGWRCERHLNGVDHE